MPNRHVQLTGRSMLAFVESAEAAVAELMERTNQLIADSRGQTSQAARDAIVAEGLLEAHGDFHEAFQRAQRRLADALIVNSTLETAEAC